MNLSPSQIAAIGRAQANREIKKLREACEWAADHAAKVRQLVSNLDGDAGTLAATNDLLEGIETKTRNALRPTL